MMSLNWNVSKIDTTKYPDLWVDMVEDARGNTRYPEENEKPTGQYLNPKTEHMIFLSMIVGIGSITEKNWKEFYARCRMYEGVCGPFWRSYKDGKHTPQMTTPEVVRDHIGLSTNVLTKRASEFYKHLSQIAQRDANDK